MQSKGAQGEDWKGKVGPRVAGQPKAVQVKSGRAGQREVQQGGAGRRAARQCRARFSKSGQSDGRKAGHGEEQQGKIGYCNARSEVHYRKRRTVRHKAGPVEDRQVGTGQGPARQGCAKHGRARSSKAKSSKAGRVVVRPDRDHKAG